MKTDGLTISVNIVDTDFFKELCAYLEKVDKENPDLHLEEEIMGICEKYREAY